MNSQFTNTLCTDSKAVLKFSKCRTGKRRSTKRASRTGAVKRGERGGARPSPEIGFRKKFLAAPLIFAIGTFRIFTVQLHVLTYESTVKRQGTDKWFQKAASYSTRKLYSDKQYEPKKGKMDKSDHRLPVTSRRGRRQVETLDDSFRVMS